MKGKGWSRSWIQQLILTGPATLAFAIIVALPFFLGMYYSFTDWNGIADNPKLVGFDNFITVFGDSTFINSFVFTVKFTLVTVILSNLVGFLLALLLTQPVKSRNVLRTIFFMPNVIGGLF